MAKLESIEFCPHSANVEDNSVRWLPLTSAEPVDGMPVVFWKDDSPWLEANIWLMEEVTTRRVTLSTAITRAASLLTYAKWLETENVHWLEFPVRRRDRCLVRYRGALIDARDGGQFAPSTATQRMQTIICFYRWLDNSGRSANLSRAPSTFSINSFHREIQSSSELSIPNRTAKTDELEDGLLPVSVEERTQIFSFCKKYASRELSLLLLTGFFTGMRIGCLADLKISTLENATPDPSGSGLFRLALGPGASPPVATKYSVTGHCWITRENLNILLEYANSPRRLLREARAKGGAKNLVFLTRYGNSYSRRGSDKSSAINVEMNRLRKLAARDGITVLKNFHFHQSRCTFASELAQIALKFCDVPTAIGIVMQALLHSKEGSALHYIKFVQKLPIKIDAANSFTREFLGLLTPTP